MSLSKPKIIATAACPFCAAPRGTQCTFNRENDPTGLRFQAMQSHVQRMELARKIAARDKKALDSIPLSL